MNAQPAALRQPSAFHLHFAMPWIVVAISLFIGALFYLLFRPDNLFYSAIGLTQPILSAPPHALFHAIPSLLHVFTLSILTWLSFDRSRKATAILIWLSINLIFEFGQLLQPKQVASLPEILRNYFVSGSFSWLDITAALLAALITYFTLNHFEESTRHA